MVKILEGAEPFSFDGNDIGVLVIHGFTGSTQSMRYLGEQFHSSSGFLSTDRGSPGHGTSPDDMATTGYRDWLGRSKPRFTKWPPHGKVFVTGLSMGGTLSLNLAAGFPNSSPQWRRSTPQRGS